MDKNVFVIIVSYNGERWLKKNLEALEASLYPVSTIVIDNKSSDNSVAIAQSFPSVKVLALNSNLGFGKANNIGLKMALEQQADYVFLLNQDAWVFPETIGNLVQASQAHTNFGVLSPLHYSGDGIHLDENFKTYWERKTSSLDKYLDEVPFVNAAAWLLPIDVIKKVGYFEPLFSHYGEDRNYCDRILYHNFKIGVLSSSKICHDRTISRSFKKDLVQSKFLLLTEVLNINQTLFAAYFKTFHKVVGLPKYFKKYYSVKQTCQFFFVLLWYYMLLKLHIFTVVKSRKSYR
ncbi:MAG TPA: glycosyltransferase family 2 protein [Flavobacteriaceae bacterium]|nr:glycosyltransferase family 2 protein [Flavobacteriaceae bacterium]